MKPSALTTGIWLTSIVSLTLAGLIAGAFVVMAASLDPTDLLTAGTEPWVNGTIAVLAFLGQMVVLTIGLRAWHSVRFKAVGLIVTLIDAGIVAWACVAFYTEYL